MTRIAVIGRSANSAIAGAIPADWHTSFLDGNNEEQDFRALHGAHFALFCMSATAGFDVGFIKYWKALEEFVIPRAVVVTDLDDSDADFDESCALIARVLGEEILPIALVLHEDDGSPAALIDLLSLKVSQNERTTDAEPEVVELVMDAREELLQEIATSIVDESLSQQLLQGITPSLAILQRALINAVATSAFIPVLTSAEKGSLGRSELHELLTGVLADPEFSASLADASDEIGDSANSADIESFLNRYLPHRLLEGIVDSEISLSIEFPDEFAAEVDREIFRARVVPHSSVDRHGISLRECEVSRLGAPALLSLVQSACEYNAVVTVLAI